MKTLSYSILFFILSATLFFSCCKPDEHSSCQGAKNTVIDFTAEDLTKVPYTGFDTLYFLDQNGDTNIVRGTGKQFYYDVNYLTVPPDCPSNQTEQKQASKIEFAPIKGNLTFGLTHQKSPAWITVIVKNYPINFLGESTSIGIKNPSSSYYIDSMNINAIYYYDIRKFISFIKPNRSETDDSYVLYYNKPNGILLIESQKDNEKYSIIPKP